MSERLAGVVVSGEKLMKIKLLIDRIVYFFVPHRGYVSHGKPSSYLERTT